MRPKEETRATARAEATRDRTSAASFALVEGALAVDCHILRIEHCNRGIAAARRAPAVAAMAVEPEPRGGGDAVAHSAAKASTFESDARLDGRRSDVGTDFWIGQIAVLDRFFVAGSLGDEAEQRHFVDGSAFGSFGGFLLRNRRSGGRVFDRGNRLRSAGG